MRLVHRVELVEGCVWAYFPGDHVVPTRQGENKVELKHETNGYTPEEPLGEGLGPFRLAASQDRYGSHK